MRRREFLPALAAPLALTAFTLEADTPSAKSKGRIRQCITRDVFASHMSLADACREAANLGIQGFDLVDPSDWALLRKYNLTPSLYPMGPGGTPADGLNTVANHARLEKSLRAAIHEASAAKVPNIITFSGNRRGMDDLQGADHCVAFLNKVKAEAEDQDVTLCMELLNSKVDHQDYMFDHMNWGVDVMQRVNSPNVKILYDIHHAQIMQGNIAQTIRDHHQWIGHFHTGGSNPGRNGLGGAQELNYGFLMKVIAKTGFQGFVSHEYSPSNPDLSIQTLAQAIHICDV